jgi:hypothetical protein
VQQDNVDAWILLGGDDRIVLKHTDVGVLEATDFDFNE